MPTKLNDLKLILLSHATKAKDESALPLPDTISDQNRANKELKLLLREALLAEVETTNLAQSWRHDGDLHFGLVITDQGKAAIGLAEDDNAGISGTADRPATSCSELAVHEARSGSKIANVLALLRRREGATLAELVEATGWLPHTTRAALTGLKKKGHVIAKTKRNDTTCYQIGGVN